MSEPRLRGDVDEIDVFTCLGVLSRRDIILYKCTV